MIEFYDLCREINQFLGFAAAAFLAYRTVMGRHLHWVAAHARRWTRRTLALYSATLTLVGAGAVQYEATRATAGPISPFITLAVLAVIGQCVDWPHHKEAPHGT